MKKLRLIKPWHMRTVHQRLCLENIVETISISRNAAPEGPAGDAQATVRIPGDVCHHFSHFSPERTACPNNAPFSDVIFASVRS